MPISHSSELNLPKIVQLLNHIKMYFQGTQSQIYHCHDCYTHAPSNFSKIGMEKLVSSLHFHSKSSFASFIYPARPGGSCWDQQAHKSPEPSSEVKRTNLKYNQGYSGASISTLG